jgi:predicted DNA-binding transcriptional regulator YafY
LRMSNTATRLITLIMLLEHRPNQKAGELAESLGVSVRTLHRYIGMLDDLGIPIYSERGPQGGFSLVRGYKMPPLIFTPTEAAALCLGTGVIADLWGHFYNEAARSAVAKLENILPEDQLAEVKWARRALVNSPLPRANLQPFLSLLDSLRKALRAQKRVHLVYQAGNQPDSAERDFDPYALAYRQGWWYVLGYCHLRTTIRSFRVDRVQQLEQLEIRYEIPADFDPQVYLAFESQFPEGMRIKMKLEPDYAYLATSTATNWETLEMQPDGSVIVTTHLPDIYRAAGFVFSYGPSTIVLEPDNLREIMYSWAAQIVEQYDARPDSR